MRTLLPHAPADKLPAVSIAANTMRTLSPHAPADKLPAVSIAPNAPFMASIAIFAPPSPITEREAQMPDYTFCPKLTILGDTDNHFPPSE